MNLNFTKKLYLLMALAMIMTSITAQAQLSTSKDILNAGARQSVSASITPINHYVSGGTMTLYFILDFSTPDLEYGDSLAITFPAGFTVNSATDTIAIPTEGQPAEVLVASSGTLVAWGDDDNNYGGIEPGQYIFEVNVTIGAAVSGPKTVNFYLSGDEYGAAPNFYSGTFILNELPASPDLIISGELQAAYTMVPLNQLKASYGLTAEVFNYGSPLTVAQNAVATNTQASYNSTVALTTPLNTYATESVTFNPISFSAIGNYNIIVGVPYGGDFNLSNNVDTVTFAVTDTILARDNGVAEGGLGIVNPTTGAATPGILGSMFELQNTGYLTSVSLYLDDPTAGDTFRVEIYNFTTTPTNKIGESMKIVVPSSNPGWITVPLDQTLTLSQGKYFIGIHQISGFISLGFTEEIFIPTVTWFKTTTDPAFTLGESAGLEATFMVRANMGSTAPLSAPVLSLPSNNAVNINNTTVTLDWNDVLGASSYEYQYSTSSSFTAGTTTTASSALSTATVNNLQLNTTYYWRVRAVSSTPGAWSNTWSFTTVQFPVGIDATAKSEVKVFPNPASDMINISNLNNAEISIYNILGSRVKNVNNISGNTMIDVSDLANGAYIITVKSADATITKKVTIKK